MAFTWVVAGWGAVTVLFLAWEEIGRRFRRDTPSNPAIISASIVEALLLTLFSSLWFASLGSGGWLLLFLLLAALMELPPRLRRRESRQSWKQALGAIARIVVAGGVLRGILG
ncbi:MAG TPA: hypothetical protein VLD58_02315 [Gemmatimonadales bacterium]|nr:hypothetical protein [Gemmatimonadales bacterium]